jgi:hypothetical protein
MSYRPRLIAELRRERASIIKLRILKEAHRRGFVTNAGARKIGGWKQGWFHLNKMVEAGVLVYSGYNRWAPSPDQIYRKRGRPRHLEL